MHDVLTRLVRGEVLSESGAEDVFERLFAGGVSEPQIASMLSLIQARGPSLDELVGAARVMRRHVTPVAFTPDPAAGPATLIDTCGTGGTPKMFNVSTAAAIVTAAARGGPRRVYVAKHGNRSRTGRGSAEVLAVLGVNVDAPPDAQARCLSGAGVCFCFAIHHHPAAKHAAGVRKALGFPTIFNLLGPLTNPAGASRQLMGVFDARYVEPMAHALARLGAQRAIVLHSEDGLDELTTTARTLVAHVEGGSVRTEWIDPVAIGVPRARFDDLAARDLDHAAGMVREAVEGRAGPARDIVELNAGAALLVGGASATLNEGIALARAAIDSGAAAATLTELARLSNA